jgi:UDP-N-acetylglucosamine 2-epimerase (non-hydrolysing)
VKIISIVGARPQIIKCAPVSRELRKNHHEIIIHTGQHYDHELSSLFFDELHIPKPDYNLGVGSGSHGLQTGEMLIKIEKILLNEKPDLVLIYGDTNSTIAGALASSKLHIPTGHIEAGLRSFDRDMPEEINRVVSDHISDLLFAPTVTGVKNLNNEGIIKGVFNVGDVMYDALLTNIKIAEKYSKILSTLDIKSKEYYLATIHRPSNTNDKKNLANILSSFSKIKKTVVFPVHPRTLKYIKKFELKDRIGENILLIKPVGYLDFLTLEKNACKILTDSGGIQKEAYLLLVPCITLRKNTEWIETIRDGWNKLVGADEQKIINTVNDFYPENKQKKYFGNGDASKKIKKILEDNI